MSIRLKYGVAALAMLVAMSGCKKKSAEQPTVVTTTTTSPATAPVAAPPVVTAVTVTSADGVTSTSTVGDAKALEWALKQDEIKNDTQGQWASEAKVSSTYGDAVDKQSWSAWQMTGVPNVDHDGDSGQAWAPRSQDAGIEWADLAFPKAVSAKGVRIRESCGAGAIVKVEMFDETGIARAIWTGTDPTRGLNYFELSFPKTAYKTNRVKVTLATNLIPGWNEIDAVQLLSDDK